MPWPGRHRAHGSIGDERKHDHRRLDRRRHALRFGHRVAQRPRRFRFARNRCGVRGTGNPDRLTLRHPVQLLGLHRVGSTGVAEHQTGRGQVVDRSQLAVPRHHHVELIGAAVDEEGIPAALAQRLEVGQQCRAQADEDRDHDAERDCAAVELQRIVEHAGVAPHDRVLDPTQQESPTADLDLGGQPETRHGQSPILRRACTASIAPAMSSPSISLSCSTSRLSKSIDLASLMSRACSPASTSCRA